LDSKRGGGGLNGDLFLERPLCLWKHNAHGGKEKKNKSPNSSKNRYEIKENGSKKEATLAKPGKSSPNGEKGGPMANLGTKNRKAPLMLKWGEISRQKKKVNWDIASRKMLPKEIGSPAA